MLQETKYEKHNYLKSVKDTPNFSVSIDKDQGTYNVTIKGKAWLQNAPTFVMLDGKEYSTKDGSLKMVGHEEGPGFDTLGAYDHIRMTYQPLTQKGVNANFSIGFKIYSKQNFVIFDQV